MTSFFSLNGRLRRPGRSLAALGLLLLLALLRPLGARAQYVVSTLAGGGANGKTSGSNDGTGTAALFNAPAGVAVDGAGNVYVADRINHRIRKVSPAGVVTTLAGGGANGTTSGSNDGTGTAALFLSPFSLAVTADGTVYVADSNNNKIRQVSPAGVVTTLAGGGATRNAFGSTDGVGTAALFNSPNGVAVDGAGTVYVADRGNHKIRKVSPAGVVTTLAGGGANGTTSGSNDGMGTAALFNTPYGVAVDGVGTVYVADYGNQKIRKVSPAGVVTTLAGGGTNGTTPGSTNGTGTAALFNSLVGLAVDGAGAVYVADYGNNKIRKVSPAGVVTTLAGGGANGSTAGSNDGTATAALFSSPTGVAVDGAGAVYVADYSNHKIRKVAVPAAVPALTSLSPTNGPVGTSITLTGTDLTGATGVSFNGTAATTFAVVNATTATATVPTGATSGLVTVTTPGGTSNGQAFVVAAPTNNALAYDGTDDYVDLPSSTPVPVGNSSYTIEAWIKPTSMGGYGIVGWGAYGVNNQVNALRLSPSGIINYWWAADLTVATPDLSGQWHHVAATFDGATRTIYLDGVAQGSDNPGAHAVPNASNLRIGSTNGGEYFPGSIDEVRIYSVGLTQAQVQADMYSAGGAAAVPASQVAYYNFDQGVDGGNNAGVTNLPNLASAANPGTLTNFALTGTSSNWVRSFPTITGISPGSGQAGINVTITGTNLTDITALTFNGTPLTSFAPPVNDLTVTYPVPNGATTGPVSIASGTLTNYTGPVFTVLATTAVTWTGAVSTDWATAGNWSPTVVPTAGIDVAIPAAPADQPVVSGVQYSRNLTVAAGARLTLAANARLGVGNVSSNPTCNLTLGSGSTFAQGAGSETYITGDFTNNGATFALDPLSEVGFGLSGGTTHLLNGTAGVTFQTLTVGELGPGDALIVQVPTQVRRKLGVYNSFASAGTGGSLTLLSDATGTALVENGSAGAVNGPVTVQRYIDPSLNAGAGYRHYSAPVSNSTVADLATTGFAPVLNSTYNTSATPLAETPFPTVFGYDQSRLATTTNNLSAFDKGWFSPTATTDPLTVGQGYAVNIASTQLVDFVGLLNNGTVTQTLSRNAGATAADAGWHLLGNPYPAPLDLSLVSAADRVNLDAASYVFSSTTQYGGTYRAYVNGIGGNPVLPVAQGFFARVSTGQTSGTLTFRNSHRLTAPDATTFQRPAADPRPLVQLDLRGTAGTDPLYVYAQAGATPGTDTEFDAVKMPNSTGMNLSSSAAGEALAIDGRPAFTAATVLPLNVGVPAAGTYTLSAAALRNLPAGLDAYLRDAQTGQTVNLRTQPNYSFVVTAAQASALLVGRFTLQFSASTALATAPALLAAQVQLYPNPAHARFAVLMPGVAGATAVQAELVNTLGQVVRRQSAALPASGATLTVETGELAAGVYTLRLLAGPTTVAKRVVIE